MSDIPISIEKYTNIYWLNTTIAPSDLLYCQADLSYTYPFLLLPYSVKLPYTDCKESTQVQDPV
jgi:hypothetical protein